MPDRIPFTATADRPDRVRSNADRPYPAWTPWCLTVGGLLGFSAVAAGALAAHLPASLVSPAHRVMLREAVQVQGWHAPALLCCGLLGERTRSHPAARLLALSAAGFAIGTVLFAAGVDGLALGGGRAWAVMLGRAAPIGGVVLLASWLLLLVATLLRGRAADPPD